MSLLPACTYVIGEPFKETVKLAQMGKKMRREHSFNYHEQVLYAKERPGRLVYLAREREWSCMRKHFGFYVLTAKRKKRHHGRHFISPW